MHLFPTYTDSYIVGQVPYTFKKTVFKISAIFTDFIATNIISSITICYENIKMYLDDLLAA